MCTRQGPTTGVRARARIGIARKLAEYAWAGNDASVCLRVPKKEREKLAAKTWSKLRKKEGMVSGSTENRCYVDLVKGHWTRKKGELNKEGDVLLHVKERKDGPNMLRDTIGTLLRREKYWGSRQCSLWD